MELTEFLLARIAEDEANAGRKADHLLAITRPQAPITMVKSPFSPTRVLADCEAKREIVTDYRRWDLLAKRGDMAAMGTAAGLRVACLRLAAVYEDHRDFDPIWRP